MKDSMKIIRDLHASYYVKVGSVNKTFFTRPIYYCVDKVIFYVDKNRPITI